MFIFKSFQDIAESNTKKLFFKVRNSKSSTESYFSCFFFYTNLQTMIVTTNHYTTYVSKTVAEKLKLVL